MLIYGDWALFTVSRLVEYHYSFFFSLKMDAQNTTTVLDLPKVTIVTNLLNIRAQVDSYSILKYRLKVCFYLTHSTRVRRVSYSCKYLFLFISPARRYSILRTTGS